MSSVCGSPCGWSDLLPGGVGEMGDCLRRTLGEIEQAIPAVLTFFSSTALPSWLAIGYLLAFSSCTTVIPTTHDRSVTEPISRNIRQFTEFLSRSWDTLETSLRFPAGPSLMPETSGNSRMFPLEARDSLHACG